MNQLAAFFLGFHRLRWSLTALQYMLCIVVVNSLLYQIPLYQFALSKLRFDAFDGVWIFVVLIGIVVLINLIFISLICLLPYIHKGIFILFACLNSMALYFEVSYQVILDKPMIGNIFNTHLDEATSYFNPTQLFYFFCFGIVPSYCLLKVRVVSYQWWQLLTCAAISALLLFGLILVNGSSWLWFDKHSKYLGGLYTPWSYSINSISHIVQSMDVSPPELLPQASLTNDEPLVVVLIIGESARAANFSLYGYSRQTNPLLEQEGVVVVQNTQSCSTYTTKSIRCMLSHLGTDDSFETLPSYLQRTGIDVSWITNNWGEPPMHLYTRKGKEDFRSDCRGDGCQHDELLLTNLQHSIEELPSDKALVVLHTSGSHGPSYHSKYPKKFEKYTPVCRNVQLSQCTQEELLNAYDNTIVYTDHFINTTITLLKSLSQPSLLIYVSDHGESLGEHGTYLHGLPYAIAPDVQKDIPFIVWLSDEFSRARSIDMKQFSQNNSHSHSHVFHSVLGAFGVQSAIYNPDLDIFVTAAERNQ